MMLDIVFFIGLWVVVLYLTLTHRGREILFRIQDKIAELCGGKTSESGENHDNEIKSKKAEIKPIDSPEHEYWRRNRFFYDLIGRMKHNKQTLRSDWRIDTLQNGDRRVAIIDRTDIWTDENLEDLQKRGYTIADHLYDTIAMSGVLVVMRISGGHVFDVTQRDEQGRLMYSQDTAATLHDVMTSTATEDFLKGMSKAAAPRINMQQIAFIAIIAGGALLGLYMLGFFR